MTILGDYETVNKWSSRVAPSTAKINERLFNDWLNWIKENRPRFSSYDPDQLIEYQKTSDNGSRYDMVDLIQSFIIQHKGRLGYKKKIRSALRSFFLHNRAELPRDPSFTVRSEKESVRGKLSVEHIRDIILSSNKTYRAIYLAMFQGGMDQEAFLYWNLNGLQDTLKQINEGKDIIKIELPGRKKQRNLSTYHTWIGPNAVEALKDYLKTRPHTEGAIFINQLKKPISKHAVSHYWLRHTDEINIIARKKNNHSGNRYGCNVHELRDVFRSQWEKSSAKGSVAEFAMGHMVDQLEYNKAHRDESWTLSEYRKALPMLQLMTRGEPYGLVESDEVDKLRAEVQRLESEKNDRVSTLETKLEKLIKLVEEKEKLEN